MKLLAEMTQDVEYLTEATDDGKKSHYIRGIFLQGNIKNRNGRIYPVDVLSNELKKYNENYIAKNRAYGELNHPNTPSINLDRVSHLITEIKQDGNNFIGKAKILDTPNGKIAKCLMDEGCRLGVSSRGLGSLKESAQGRIVQPDFFLTTAADLVSDPSAPDAFVDNLMEEPEWIMTASGWVPGYVEKVVKPLVESVSKPTVSKEQKQAQFEKLFNNFIEKLGNSKL